MTYVPRFQPQLQANDPLGPLSCTCYAGAMAVDYDKLGNGTIPTGRQIRLATGDTSGGTNLAQVDAACQRWGTNLDVHYRMPFTDFQKKINAGCAGILQGGYAPIADSRFDAGNGFRGNHALLVIPGYVTLEPLADGRKPGVYRFKGEAYPQSLLRSFAGRLDIGNDRLLGAGLVYAAFTRDNVHTYSAVFDGGAFWVYSVQNGVIVGRHADRFSAPTSAPCTAPKVHSWPAAKTTRNLVQVAAGRLAHEYVAVPQSNVHVRLVP